MSGTKRELGQFWTPAWVAQALLAYVVRDGVNEVFDPAVGTGAFIHAARRLASRLGRNLLVYGMELDPTTLVTARQQGISEEELSRVQVGDFLQAEITPCQGIVANPPYVRHHLISPETKSWMRAYSSRLLGAPLDGRAGLHVYFFLKSLSLLKSGGRLAFIVPSDICEGVFAPRLWNWVTDHFRLETVITFDPAASPFPDLDVNPVIFLVRNSPAQDQIDWVRCYRTGDGLTDWLLTGDGGSDLEIIPRSLEEALHTGLSRPACNLVESVPLGELIEVKRGIATGCNDFFLLTSAQIQEYNIPTDFLVRTIARTRDVVGDEIREEDLERLDAAGRPTWLLSLDDRPLSQFPAPVQEYIRWGEEQGLHLRPLLSTRNPWYKTEQREIPPFLFAYLGRRNSRFIRNQAGVVPLSCFLCVYPRHAERGYIERLWKVLSSPQVNTALPLVGKSYGKGAVKVEPRSLERLPVPTSLLESSEDE